MSDDFDTQPDRLGSVVLGRSLRDAVIALWGHDEEMFERKRLARISGMTSPAPEADRNPEVDRLRADVRAYLTRMPGHDRCVALNRMVAWYLDCRAIPGGLYLEEVYSFVAWLERLNGGHLG